MKTFVQPVDEFHLVIESEGRTTQIKIKIINFKINENRTHYHQGKTHLTVDKAI